MLTIGKVAKRTGFSASAIRYYERQGLLRPSRLLNGYRVYDEDAVKALRFLCQAQTLGITLKEIKQLLELARSGRRPCKAVRQLASQHIADIDAKIRGFDPRGTNCAICCRVVLRPVATNYAR